MPAPRKRQQRLSFTPLPSSSPAAKGYNKQIQDRAAAVTVQGSPSKRRKLRKDDGEVAQMDGVNDSMPTPAATLERKGNRTNGTGIPAEEEEEDSDDIPLVPTQRSGAQSKRRRPRQQRLDFSNTRDADSFDSPVRLSSSARPPSTEGTGMFASQRRRATITSSDDESNDELPSPAKLLTTKKKESKKLRKSKKEKDEEKRTTRSMRRSSQIDQESDEDKIVVSSPRQLPLEVESEDDEEDEMPSTMATQRRKRTRKQATPDSFISSSPPPGPIDSDDDLEIIEKPSQKRKRRADSDEDEDEDAAPITPGRRKLKRPRKINQQEADDLAEDMDFLGPSSDVESSARKPRNTQTTQKEARQSALDKLKRKRSNQTKQPEPILVDDDTDAEEQDSDEGDDYDDDDDGDDVEEVQQAPMSSRQYFTANDEDEDFIQAEDDEDDGILGHPDPNIPIQFTRFASMKPKELFPFAMEWMVQKKINPAFSMDDEIYDLTFKKLNDEVRGLAGSKFTSSAWTEEFTYALNARPDIAYEPLDRSGEHYMNDHCDACNRSGHPATYQIQFQGQPYHRGTLEEVNNDVDSDSDSDDGSSSSSDEEKKNSKPSWDAEGREIVPVHKVFFVGKFCMGNASTAHSLQHWKYHLNEWVVTYLTKEGYLKPAEIVKRDGWKERKRRKHANKIADYMEKTGVTERLWKDFRASIDQARDAKQGGRW